MTLARKLQLVNSDTEAQWMEAALKVAFATADRQHVDQHFGAAKSFAVYAVDQEQTSLVEASEFGILDMDGNEDKLSAKIAALEGCAAVYTQAVGASAIAQLKAQGIQPMKVPAGTPIKELLASLQEELRQGPASWLARAIKQQSGPADPSRFDDMEAEGWQE